MTKPTKKIVSISHNIHGILVAVCEDNSIWEFCPAGTNISFYSGRSVGKNIGGDGAGIHAIEIGINREGIHAIKNVWECIYNPSED